MPRRRMASECLFTTTQANVFMISAKYITHQIHCFQLKPSLLTSTNYKFCITVIIIKDMESEITHADLLKEWGKTKCKVQTMTLNLYLLHTQPKSTVSLSMRKKVN